MDQDSPSGFKSKSSDICGVLALLNGLKLLLYLTALSILIAALISQRRDIFNISSLFLNYALYSEIIIFLTIPIWIYFFLTDLKNFYFGHFKSPVIAAIGGLIPGVNIFVFYITCFDAVYIWIQDKQHFHSYGKALRFWSYAAIFATLFFMAKTPVSYLFKEPSESALVEMLIQNSGKICIAFFHICIFKTFSRALSVMTYIRTINPIPQNG